MSSGTTWSGRNAVGGSHGGPGDGDGGIHHTAGIVVWSAATKITRIEVSGNRISQNHFGIWTKNTPRLRQAANHFKERASSSQPALSEPYETHPLPSSAQV